MWYVYILKSGSARWYYVGSSNNLERRIAEHNKGKVTSTKRHVPLTLVFAETFGTEQEARQYERRLKDKRKEKEEIIARIEQHCQIV